MSRRAQSRMGEEMAESAGTWHAVGAAEEIGPGEMAAREVAGVQIALYNVGGALFATDSVCTHAYALLSDGWLDDDVVECPLHGGQFSVRTGKALSDPAEQDLRTYPVRIVEGQVEILLPA